MSDLPPCGACGSTERVCACPGAGPYYKTADERRIADDERRIAELEKQVKELTILKQAYKRKLDRLERVVIDVCEAVADEIAGVPEL